MLEETPQVSGSRQISDLVTQSVEGCGLAPRLVGTTRRALREAVRLATIAVTGIDLPPVFVPPPMLVPRRALRREVAGNSAALA